MRRIKIFFKKCPMPYALCHGQRGGMLVDLLLTVALVAIVLPFIFNFQRDRINRARDMQLTREMSIVQTALERYINAHRTELLTPVGKNITRVSIADLGEYGISDDLVQKYGDDFQLRILKSNNRSGHQTLQGVIVLNNSEITPMRTRALVNMGNDKLGFVDGNQAFGGFGTWRANTSDLEISENNGIVGTTKTTLDNELYLWRLPSENAEDATMLSGLNLSGHNIINSKMLNADGMQFEEFLTADKIIADKTVFQTQTTLDQKFQTNDATVAGTLSADSRTLNVANALTLSDTAKLSNFTADNLWTDSLNLSGLSINIAVSGDVPVLKVNQAIDMASGYITTMLATIGFTGSITPKLYVHSRVEDSTNSAYYWDAASSDANLADISIGELNRMAAIALADESAAGTGATQVWATVVANKNATASDFMRAITEIQKRVRAKYSRLKL
jgi:Tfp pilus assembly protein PilE